MQVKKAVITAAGAGQRRLPLQTLIDADGCSRSVLAILVNEILTARIEQVCVIVHPGDESAYAEAVPEHQGLLRFVPQPAPLGYADALLRAREWVSGDPFLHLVGDHLYLGSNTRGCAAALVEMAEAESCAVSAVRSTPERLLGSFGVIAGRPLTGKPGLFRVEEVLEKPTPTVAEQRLIVPGLRAGHYLAFFGMHVLPASIFDLIAHLRDGRGTLSDALTLLAKKEAYLALQVTAERYDLGERYGLLSSQLALALTGRDRDEVLTMLVGLLASHPFAAPGTSRA